MPDITVKTLLDWDSDRPNTKQFMVEKIEGIPDFQGSGIVFFELASPEELPPAAGGAPKYVVKKLIITNNFGNLLRNLPIDQDAYEAFQSALESDDTTRSDFEYTFKLQAGGKRKRRIRGGRRKTKRRQRSRKSRRASD
jgi:hypothetical protein